MATGTAASAPRQRTDDRERSGRGGRGGARGGRGGYHGNASDGGQREATRRRGALCFSIRFLIFYSVVLLLLVCFLLVHRNFDRKQGEHSKHAPGEARKHGAVGEVDNSQFSGSAAEFSAQDAAQVADANGDIVGDMIMEMVPVAVDPEDQKLSYDEYLASKSQVDDDVNRQRREVIVPDANDENFKAVKQFKKEEEASFFDAVKTTKSEEKAEKSEKKAKKGKISLDEFVGVSGPVAQTESGEREGSRGGRGGARGGRGGFDGASRGGFDGPRRGGFDGPRRGGFDGASRGGRGGRDGEAASSAPRGGRGGARGGRGGFDSAPRGGRGGAFVPRGAPAANVNIADQSAFPALSPK